MSSLLADSVLRNVTGVALVTILEYLAGLRFRLSWSSGAVPCQLAALQRSNLRASWATARLRTDALERGGRRRLLSHEACPMATFRERLQDVLASTSAKLRELTFACGKAQKQQQTRQTAEVSHLISLCSGYTSTSASCFGNLVQFSPTRRRLHFICFAP